MCFGALLCPLYIIDIFLIIYIERFWIPIPISYSNQLNCIAILSPGYFSSMCVGCFFIAKRPHCPEFHCSMSIVGWGSISDVQTWQSLDRFRTIFDVHPCFGRMLFKHELDEFEATSFSLFGLGTCLSFFEHWNTSPKTVAKRSWACSSIHLLEVGHTVDRIWLVDRLVFWISYRYSSYPSQLHCI